jgi:amidase
VIEAAIDAALAAAELEVVELDFDEVRPGADAFPAIFFSEVWDVDHALVEADPDGVGDDIKMALGLIDMFGPGLPDARAAVAAWKQALADLFTRVELLALPTMPIFPPRIDAITPESFFDLVVGITSHVALFNPAGVPATAQPVPAAGSRLPASLQLVGPVGGEELLLPTAARVEAALA